MERLIELFSFIYYIIAELLGLATIKINSKNLKYKYEYHFQYVAINNLVLIYYYNVCFQLFIDRALVINTFSVFSSKTCYTV